MNSADYWAQRELQDREALIDTAIEKVNKQLQYQYKRSEQVIEQLMLELYNKILLEAGTEKALVSDIYKFNRYYELVEKINIELKRLGSKEKVVLSNELKSLYVQNAKIIGGQLGISTDIKPELVSKVINDIWCSDGTRWSSRIWTHKTQLVQSLTNGLIDCVATGASPDKLIEMIMSKFSASYNSARRLVRTELSHIYNQAAFDKYKEAGIEQYRFLTAQDEKTCDKCSPLDLQVFKMDDAETGVNFPPVHCNCRCTILAVIN